MKVFNNRRSGMKMGILAATIASITFSSVAMAQSNNSAGNENNDVAETVVSTSEIPFNVRYVDDYNLPEGLEIVTEEGQNGKIERVRADEPSRLGGIVNSTVKEKDVVTLAPSEEVVRVGKNKDTIVPGVDKRVEEIETRKKEDIYKAQESARLAAEKKKEEESLADAEKRMKEIMLSSGSSSSIQLPSNSSVPVPNLSDTSSGGVTSPAENRAFLETIVSGQELECAHAVIMKESGYVTTATNPSSGAYGVAQSLPATKYSTHGSDWKTNGKTQILWMKDYVDERYGSFCGALDWHHVNNWY